MSPASQMLAFAAPRERSQSSDLSQQHETSEREDSLDQHVADYLKHNPEVHQKHCIARVRHGVYNDNGREILVEWDYLFGHLVAIDGPLRQPFADYMQETENGIQYDDKRLGQSALSQIPQGNRLSFGDTGKAYGRLEAMKVAKEQALIREKAADYVKDGMPVPQHELMAKYNKTISQKLGERRQMRPEPAATLKLQAPAEAPLPHWWPAPAAAAPPPPSAASPPAASHLQETAQRTHGAPKYCVNHCKTEQRKKTKPQNLPCSTCQSLIQTNYVKFALCPTCSEKDHRCMCCGAAALAASPAASPSPQASKHAPGSPMDARASPQLHAQSKSLAQQHSPMNLFSSGLFNSGVTKTTTPQNNSLASNQGYPLQKLMVSKNPHASHIALAPYNPVAVQNPLASQNIVVER